MMEPDDRRWVRQEISRQLEVLLNASAGENTAISENIESMYAGSPTQIERPIMHPYGFVSRAPRGTVSVVARQGEHAGNRMTIGHRDPDRPDDLSEGDAAVYSVAGYTVYLTADAAYIGSGTDSAEAILLGETVVDFLKALLDAIAAHTHGSPGSPPANAAEFIALKTQNLEDIGPLPPAVLSQNAKVN